MMTKGLLIVRRSFFASCRQQSVSTTLLQKDRSRKIPAILQDFRTTQHLPCSNVWGTALVRWHGGPTVADDAPTVDVTFIQPNDTERIVKARVGETLLQTAHRNDIDLEGACEGVCACSTCHIILPMDVYDNLPEASEDEEDMLDMAFGLTETSRLGCQIKVTNEMNGLILRMPKATRNFYVDGHIPKPH